MNASPIRVLTPHEVISNWEALSQLLAPAVARCNGELEIDDIRQLVLSGRMFVLASDRFALTCEFVVYPRKTVMLVGFGAGEVPEGTDAALTDFGRRAGATSMQAYVAKDSMVRYLRHHFGGELIYRVIERPL